VSSVATSAIAVAPMMSTAAAIAPANVSTPTYAPVAQQESDTSSLPGVAPPPNPFAAVTAGITSSAQQSSGDVLTQSLNTAEAVAQNPISWGVVGVLAVGGFVGWKLWKGRKRR
jgi:hypothetical protein